MVVFWNDPSNSISMDKNAKFGSWEMRRCVRQKNTFNRANVVPVEKSVS